MATMTTTMPVDVPVAVKVNINGADENRKFKLNLRDLPASVLPEKLRGLLAIPSDKQVVFERYSDSSASFITLDSANPAVYKQLYRAAKAKGKLRLRATIEDKPSSKPEMSEPPPKSERLPVHCYVHPYISDPAIAESSPSSRISTLEDLKTLAAAPSAVTLTPSMESDSKRAKATDFREPPRQPYSWPVSEDRDFSQATKIMFQKKDLKKLGTQRSAADKDTDEAPVPRFWAAQDHRLVNLAQPMGKCLRKPLACTGFTICCNSCDKSIANAHWHCGICDAGDFDLCEECVEKGNLCGNEEHWMIKRFVEDGKVINSTTETMAPKKSSRAEEKAIPGAFTCNVPDLERTCNSCVGVFHESKFVTCIDCDDYDLCLDCHRANNHGHHPKHAFDTVSPATNLDVTAFALCRPGRNAYHFAICDGCDKNIYGVRHKCLNCPDWDYCSECIVGAQRSHPSHRFAALYEPIPNQRPSTQVHYGIYCDGPQCEGKECAIRGDRFKCAVCHDTDFCASCEASPMNSHNRTHPLLKFRTPVRNVSVSTFGEKANGEQMRAMGDQPPPTSSKSTETTPAPSANAATQVQTVAEVKPVEAIKEEPKEASPSIPAPKELHAIFIRDAVIDGSKMPPSNQFAQTWTLRNPGPHAWPAGSSVCFIGGDGMLDVDPNHPSHITQIRKAIRSNTVDRIVEVGEEVDFSVVMRAPEREGKAISYWRLKTANGLPFGHKLWCDVDVRKPLKAETVEEPAKTEHIEDIAVKEEAASSRMMIFPKLDKESPASSIHQGRRGVLPMAPPVVPTEPSVDGLADDVESLELDDDDESEGFLTDEEYELIASGDEIEVARNGKK